MLGKYALQRESFLKVNAPELYEEMESEGSLETHLNSIQETVNNYVTGRVDRLKNTDEYKSAEASGDFAKTSRMITTEVLSAELDAGEMWIYNVPIAEEEEPEPEETDDDDYEFDDYDDEESEE